MSTLSKPEDQEAPTTIDNARLSPSSRPLPDDSHPIKFKLESKPPNVAADNESGKPRFRLIIKKAGTPKVSNLSFSTIW